MEGVAGLIGWAGVGCVRRLCGDVSGPNCAPESACVAYWDGHYGVGDEQFLLPVQDEAAGEVPAGFDGGHGRHDLLSGSSRARYQPQRLRRRRPLAEPSLVVGGHIDRTVENLCPGCVGGVVMGM